MQRKERLNRSSSSICLGLYCGDLPLEAPGYSDREENM